MTPVRSSKLPQREAAFGVWSLPAPKATPTVRYLIVLSSWWSMTWIASNIIHGRIGRSWMMIRDMDIAAELMGVRPLCAKLSAFAVSSFYCGVAGAMMVFFWLGAAEVESFDVNHSFLILFMVILAAWAALSARFWVRQFIWMLPIVIKRCPGILFGWIWRGNGRNTSISCSLVVLIIFLPDCRTSWPWRACHGSGIKEKLRVWPFPY